MKKIGIVGAGISGLVLACFLKKNKKFATLLNCEIALLAVIYVLTPLDTMDLAADVAKLVLKEMERDDMECPFVLQVANDIIIRLCFIKGFSYFQVFRRTGPDEGCYPRQKYEFLYLVKDPKSVFKICKEESKRDSDKRGIRIKKIGCKILEFLFKCKADEDAHVTETIELYIDICTYNHTDAGTPDPLLLSL